MPATARREIEIKMRDTSVFQRLSKYLWVIKRFLWYSQNESKTRLDVCVDNKHIERYDSTDTYTVSRIFGERCTCVNELRYLSFRKFLYMQI